MESLVTQAMAFVAGDLLPTLAALAVVAAREPLTWFVLAAAAAGRPAWRRLMHLD